MAARGCQSARPTFARGKKRLSQLSGEVWRFPSQHLDHEVLTAFSSLDKAFACDGEFITASPISEVVRTSLGNRTYYVKKYWRRGKYLRRFVGRSRVRAEWENLLFFQSLGIGVPGIVAYGERGASRWLNKKYRGVLITEELANTEDLASMAGSNALGSQPSCWIKSVSAQVARAVARLHEQNFFHNDLKFRNILVTKTDEPEVFMIDCPTGRKQPGVLWERYKVKDIACLDKVAKQQLSRTQRLQFFKMYRGKQKLDANDRRFLRKVVGFFDGRE